MYDQMMLYKHQGKLEELCERTIGFAFFLIAFLFILSISGTLIIILSPEELNPISLFVLIIVDTFIIVTWWCIYKYYALDIILSLDVLENVYNLRTHRNLYCVAKEDIILIKEGLFGENIVIVFRSKKGKKYKKHFKKYITLGLKKVENLNVNILKTML